MTIANVFFGSIIVFTFGYIGYHYYQEWKSEQSKKGPMAVFNKR